MFHRLLIATNLNDGIHRLIHFVASLANGGVTEILFCHSVPLWQEGEIPRIDQEGINRARDRLSIAKTNFPAGVQVQVQVTSGLPGDTLMNGITNFHPDLVILGTPVRSLLNENLLGSTTQHLLLHLQVPILALRPPLLSALTNEELDLRCRHLWRFLLIPFNGTDAAQRLLQLIKSYIQRDPLQSHGVERCTLLWILDTKGKRDIPKSLQIEQAEAALAKAKGELVDLNLDVEGLIRWGDPLTETVKYASEQGFSAIATNSTYNNRWLDWTVPSLGRDLLRSSWHPVLYIPKHCVAPLL